MNRRLSMQAALVAGLVLAGCARGGEPGPWVAEAGYRWRALRVPRGTAGFTALNEGQTGIRFQNTLSDSLLLRNRVLGQGAGVALGDVDGDGLVDVFLARTEGPNALYRNLGGWRFEDITASAGVAAADRYSTGAALVDLDGDGDLDLILLATLGPNAIFLNDGAGHFTEHRGDLGLDSTGRGGTTLALADVDGDGDLDLYVANYKPYTPMDRLSPQQRAFNQLAHQVTPGHWDVLPEHRRDYKLVHREDMGGLSLSIRAEPDQFYLNSGGRFTAVPLTGARFRDSRGSPMVEPAESFALDARFADLDGDGTPELYVVNDFEDPDQLWFNDGHGGFRLADWTVQRQTSNSGMGADVGDLNGDGRPDLFEVDMLSNDSRRLKTQLPTHTALPKRPGAMEVQLQQQRNTLFLNRGDGTFAELAAYAGVQASGWSWSTLLLDVDLDGWQDLLIANGHVRDVMDADTQERLQTGWTGSPWQAHFFEFPPLPLHNVAYRNRGNLTFEDRGTAWGFDAGADISHALATADLDGDGDLDVVVNRLGAPALILRNNAPAPRLAVRLIGKAPNTQAVGAKIRVLGGAVPLQEHEVTAGGLYLSHSDYLASFATGSAASVNLEVVWRSGRRTFLTGVSPNRLYEITEPEGDPTPVASLLSPPPLFEDVSAELGGHHHTENPFDDWDRQYLLPDALSELGPGLAWFDLDRDGDEDLVVGTGKGGRIAVFRNDQGHLAPQPLSGPVAPNDFTTVLGLAEASGTRVLAGVSTWEVRELAELTAQPGAISLRAAGTTLSSDAVPVVTSHESAIGPLALGDYDGDGALDLFVGGRAIPMRYPVPATSGLFHNTGGRFEFDAANSAGLRSVGLVSAAQFSDLNGDGHLDLLLAREWGSLLLLLNDGHGHLVPAPESWGLGRWNSRWIGVATGDLDGDGRLDIVATSWGRNRAEQPDSARPLLLVYGTFGAMGEEEMLLARQDPRLGGVAPLDRFERVRMGFPALTARISSFATYSTATLSQVLGAAARGVGQLGITTLDNMVFLNRGDHFEAVALPAEAQFAPAFYAGIADFDGDGNEDLFLAQNFSPTVTGAPRDDAGRGLLLRGDGRGGLTPMPGARSGILVYGDQRGAGYADFDGDGRLDLAISQNGGTTRLLHNRGARPGLRVRLQGPPNNPDGVGARIRIVYGDSLGPAREVQSGSGYWSQNGAVQVMGLRAAPTAVWVRWPDGREVRVPVPLDSREVLVAY